MRWCEEHGVDYILGLAKNSRPGWKIELEMELAKAESEAPLDKVSGKSARRFRDFTYQTRKSWSRERRVVGKAEHLAKGSNPRFVVTSLPARPYDGRSLYEKLYCARGEMENRIKEQPLMLFADRTSANDMRANQIRLYFSSVAYVLLSALRRIGLADTSLERAQCSTIRLKLWSACPCASDRLPTALESQRIFGCKSCVTGVLVASASTELPVSRGFLGLC